MFLVTLDVEPLYTNTPHDGGIEAVDFYLCPSSSDMYPPRIKESNKTPLKGRAMGSTMASKLWSFMCGTTV